MEKVHIDLQEHSYDICIGHDLPVGELVKTALPKCKDLMIVSNDTVAPLYLAKVTDLLTAQGFRCSSCLLQDGEHYKTVDSYMQIITALLQEGFGRDCAVVALGGGVVGDVAGFAAATYQRGVDFVQIPTTLLALVDSSVGGKTAINHPLGKNMVGAFYQPKLVVADLNFLNTLPPREIAAGMAEVIKYGVIFSEDFFNYLFDHAEDLDYTYVVKCCCEFKAAVVAKDEKEKGLRALLNYGHTFGHAIEVEMGFGSYLHGEGVAVGMLVAAYVAAKTKGLPFEVVDKLKQILIKYHLPYAIPSKMTAAEFMTAMHHDKKVKSGKVNYVLPTTLGQASVFNDLDDATISALIDEFKGKYHD